MISNGNEAKSSVPKPPVNIVTYGKNITINNNSLRIHQEPESNIDEAKNIEYHAPMNLYMIQYQNKKKKRSLWNSIFNKKKCKICSQYKSECKCKDIKMNKQMIPINQMKKEITKNRKYHLNFPIANRKGCGFQFSFSIENANKKGAKKSRNNISPNCIKKTIFDTTPCTNDKADNFKDNELCNKSPAVTIICSNSDERIDLHEKDSRGHLGKEKTALLEYQDSRIKTEGSEIPNESSFTKPSLNNKDHTDIDMTYSNKGSSLFDNLYNSYNGNRTNEEVRNEFSHFIKKVDVNDNIIQNRPCMSPVQDDPCPSPKLNKNISFVNSSPHQTEGEYILKEFQHYANNRKRSSSVGKAVKRSSLVENKMAMILKKLDNIEEKILELNNKYRRNGKALKISCNKKDSSVALTFDNNNRSGGSGKNTLLTINPVCEKTSTVKIKKCEDNIYLNCPTKINVVKQKRTDKKQLPVSCTPNDQNGVIQTKSTPTVFKCKNPKIIVNYSPPPSAIFNRDCNKTPPLQNIPPKKQNN